MAPPENWAPLHPRGCSDGTGSVNALGAQYEFSYTNFKQQISGGQRFWGAGRDVVLKLYTLVAFVDSVARDTTVVSQGRWLHHEPFDRVLQRLEARLPNHEAQVRRRSHVPGLAVALTRLAFRSCAAREKPARAELHVLSPRLSFKSQWVTHERITLGYSRYMYDQRTCEPLNVPSPTGMGTVGNPDPLSQWRCARPAPSPVPYDGFGTTTGKQLPNTRATGVTRPDENVFKIEATMWW